MEPGTPVPVLKRGDVSIPLAWTKRSDALISLHGHDLASLFRDLGNRRRFLGALCVGIYAALPPTQAPETPAEVNEWFADDSARTAAGRAVVSLIRHAYPELFNRAEEKKSASPS